MELIFATHNRHKLEEVTALLRPCDTVKLPSDFSFNDEIPEDHETIEANSAQKAQFIYQTLQRPVFSDDTGLEVMALNGAPGVYSARYAGVGCSFADNMEKLLTALTGIEDRRAYFRTVVTLIIDGQQYQFEGRVDGEILSERHGQGGFGYDPIFRPNGYTLSFAEMDMHTKNTLSHRARAIRSMTEFLNTQFPCQ